MNETTKKIGSPHVMTFTELSTLFPQINRTKLEAAMNPIIDRFGRFSLYLHIRICQYDASERNVDFTMQPTFERIACDDVTELLRIYGQHQNLDTITHTVHLVYQAYVDHLTDLLSQRFVSLGRILLHEKPLARFHGAIIMVDEHNNSVVTKMVTSLLVTH